MSIGSLTAAAAGSSLAAGVVLIALGLRRSPVTGPRPAWLRAGIRALARTAAPPPDTSALAQRARLAAWCAAGAVVWVLTGWPVAGVAVLVGGVWAPWLLGSAQIARKRIARLEAIEGWCRRMADTLSGGGAVGLAQAIAVTARYAAAEIADPVGVLAARLKDGNVAPGAAIREFADALDDRVADTVAAAIGLALHQQSAGMATVLRQLAEGVARDVRARREIEAARTESRQSVRMLLVIQAGVLVLLALVPSFAAPYSSPAGQLVMVVLLAATVWLLVWMRRLAIRHNQPRFVGSGAAR